MVLSTLIFSSFVNMKAQWGGATTHGGGGGGKNGSPFSHPTGGVFGPPGGGAGGTGGTSATDAAPDHHPVPRVGSGLGRVVPLLDRNTLPRRVRASRRPISSRPLAADLVKLLAAAVQLLSSAATSARARLVAGGGAITIARRRKKRE